MFKFQGGRRSSRGSYFQVTFPILNFILLQIVFIQAAPSVNTVSSPSPLPPFSSQECQISCRANESSQLQYEIGEYEYNYESEMKHEIKLQEPATTESRTTSVKASLLLTVISSCDFLLTVKTAHVNSPSGSNEVVDLSRSSMRFSLQDGVISQVCVERDDPVWSANIKRSIISLLQNKDQGQGSNEVEEEDNFLEVDVSGTCPTKYSMNDGTFVKTKNLNSCMNRRGGQTPSAGVPYNRPDLNLDPFAENLQKCEQKLENGVLKQVTCLETRKDQNSPSGYDILKTSISVSLTLSGKKEGVPQTSSPKNLIKSSIFFDHSDISTGTTKGQRETQAETAVRSILSSVCGSLKQNGGGLTTEVSDQFLNLQKEFTHLNKASTVKIYDEIQAGSICQDPEDQFRYRYRIRKLFVDAAAVSASDGGIGLLSKLYQNGELDDKSKEYFHRYTTFAPRPSHSALESVLPLIQGEDGDKVSVKLLLTVSGLAYQYCTRSNSNCLQNSAYDAIVNRIAEIVQETCQAKHEDGLGFAIAALNALGNLNQLTETAVAAISTCLGSNSNSSDRIQVQALDAFRRDPCQLELKKEAQNIFGNKNEQPNVRISAFLANLQCLEQSDASVIQQALDDPESTQVAAFIQSHLKNLLKSDSPSTDALKSAAKQLDELLKYPKDLNMKFPGSYESSLFVPKYNLGYSAQGNVLFSKESVIPRQLSANLTVDVVGNSFNFLQVGVHLENLDSMQEQIFGLLDEQSSADAEADDGGVINQDSPRTGDVFIREFGTTTNVFSMNMDSDSDFDFDTNAETSNVGYFYNQTLSSFNPDSDSDFDSNYNSTEIDYIQPLFHTNLEYQYPTIAGFAFVETMEGTLIPALKYKVNANRSSGNAQANFGLEADVSATIRARASLVAGPFELGREIKHSFESGAAINFEINVEFDKKAELKAIFPRATIGHLKSTSNILWVEKTSERTEVKSDLRPSNQAIPASDRCSGYPLKQLLQDILGLNLCLTTNFKGMKRGLAKFENLYFSAKLEKIQPSMEGYSIIFENELDAEKGEKNFSITLDTPGLANRKIEILSSIVQNVDDEAEADEDAEVTRSKFDVELKTPSRAIGAKFEYVLKGSETKKVIQVKVTLPSGPNFVLVTVGLKMELTKENTVTFEPFITLEYPQDFHGSMSTLDLLSGEISIVGGKSVHFDLAHEFQKPRSSSSGVISLKGDVRFERDDDTNSNALSQEVVSQNPLDGADISRATFNVELNIESHRFSANGLVRRGQGLFEGSTNVEVEGEKVGSADFKVNCQDNQRQVAIRGGPVGRPTVDLLMLNYTKEVQEASSGYEGTVSSDIPSFFLQGAQGPLKGSFKTERIRHHFPFQRQGSQLKVSHNSSLPGVFNKATYKFDLLQTPLEFRYYERASCQIDSDLELFVLNDVHFRKTKEPGSYSSLFKILRMNNIINMGENMTQGLVSESWGTKSQWNQTTRIYSQTYSQPMILNAYGKSLNQSSVFGVIVNHPILNKPLGIKSAVHFGGLILHQSKTEVDVYQDDSQEKIVIELLAKYEDSSKKIVQTNYSITGDDALRREITSLF